MLFFIDTANLKEIQEVNDLGILDGVTTNPSLMAKEGITGEKNILEHYKAICNIVSGDVSAEVIPTDYKGMIEEGQKLATIDPKIIVKVPITKEGVKAIKYLSSRDIRINCTLVFSAGQALLAAKAGATYVSPFMGRLDDINQDGLMLVHQIANIFSIHNIQTKVLAASIRSSLHIIKCAEIGADVVTCPYKSIMGLFKHPLTDIGLEKFLADHAKGNK